MKSPLQSEYPLSLSNNALCPKCWEEEWPRGKPCCEKCEGKKKFYLLWPSQIREIWERDKGRCANCALSTVELLESARIAYINGGQNARGHRAAILYSKGYRKEDATLNMWVLVPIDRDKKISIENSMTLCRPCSRRHRAANGRARNFVQKTLSLFDELEMEEKIEDKKYRDDENATGYTAT